MFKNLRLANKSRLFAAVAAFALTATSFASFVAPQKAEAYFGCAGLPANLCSSSVYECIAKNPQPLLKNLSSDKKCTAAVQGFLNEVGNRGLTIDGKYGDATAWQVIWFQVQTGLTPDGKVGPQTWQKMVDVCTLILAQNQSNPICGSKYAIVN